MAEDPSGPPGSDEPAAGPWPRPLWALLPYPLAAAALAWLAWVNAAPTGVPATLAAGVGWSVLAAAFLAGAGIAGRLGMLLHLRRAPEDDPDRWFAAYGRALHLAAAMRLLCAVVGYRAAITMGDPWWSVGFSAAALVSMGRGLPRRADYVALALAAQEESP